jgi:hypothetical protein
VTPAVVSSSSEWAVLLVVLGAFIAAGTAAVRAERSGAVALPGAGIPLPSVDLLSPDLPRSREPLPVRVFGGALVFLLFMYAMFDRGFAWFHVPGTVLFVGEMVIALGVVAMVSSRVRLGPVIRRQPALTLLVAWMLWGVGLMVLHLPRYGLDAVRDSAIWYYGVVAVFAVFLLVSDPSRLGRWVHGLHRAILPLLLWLPVAIVLNAAFANRPPLVPGSQISIFSHRPGNIAVWSVAIIGFIWLVDRERPRLTAGQRVAYTSLAVITLLGSGLQARGGMVAAVFAIMLMLFLMRRNRGQLGLLLAGLAVTLVSLALITNVRIPLSEGHQREISAEQLALNLLSILRTDAGGDRQVRTTEWRLRLWDAVFDDVVNESPFIGFGPGPDLGELYGVSGPQTGPPLRNPHNSHLGVTARMGFVGAGLWVVLWLVWVIVLHGVRARFRAAGRPQEAGFVGWLVVVALATLINAVFDPTLEGPQVGVWLWMIFGTGVGVSALAAAGPSLDRALTPARVSAPGRRAAR